VKYDVGVLFLAEELVFTNRVAPIELNFEWVADNEDSYVNGWGRVGPQYEDDILVKEIF
jgi:hypothetical protein